MKYNIVTNRIHYILIILLFIGLTGCKESTKKVATEKKSDFSWTTSSEEALADLEQALVLIDIGDNLAPLTMIPFHS